MNNWYAYNVLVNDRHRSRQRTANHGAAARARRASAGRSPLLTRVRGWFGGARSGSVAVPDAAPRVDPATIDLRGPAAMPVATAALDARRESAANVSAPSELDRVA